MKKTEDREHFQYLINSTINTNYKEHSNQSECSFFIKI